MWLRFFRFCCFLTIEKKKTAFEIICVSSNIRMSMLICWWTVIREEKSQISHCWLLLLSIGNYTILFANSTVVLFVYRGNTIEKEKRGKMLDFPPSKSLNDCKMTFSMIYMAKLKFQTKWLHNINKSLNFLEMAHVSFSRCPNGRMQWWQITVSIAQNGRHLQMSIFISSFKLNSVFFCDIQRKTKLKQIQKKILDFCVLIDVKCKL